MPKEKDVVLSSLIDKSIPDDDWKVIISAVPHSDKFYKMEDLTPPELVEEFEKEFKAYFGVAMGDNLEIPLNTVFFKKAEHNKTEIDSILKEHSYSKK